jgi:signal transduction histidine kinase
MISDFGLPTRDTRTNTLQPMFYLVLTLSILYLLTLGFRVGGTSWESIRSDLFNLPVGITATGFLGWAMRLQTPTMRRLMQPFFWGVLCHVLVDILQAILEFGFNIQLNSNPIDLIYLVSSLLFLVGLLRIPLRTTSRIELVRLSLDVALLILTVGILFWTSFLEKILETGGQLQIPGTVGFLSASPDLHRIPFNGTALDVIVLCVAIIVTMRSKNELQRLGILATLAILSMVVIDAVIGAQLSLQQFQLGGLLDGGFILCATIFCIGDYLSFSPQPNNLLTRQSLASVGGLSVYAPYLATILIYVPLVRSHLDSDFQDIVGVMSAALITALVLVRQIMVLRENRNLTTQLLDINNQLEQRVIDRTKELEDSRERLVSSEKLASIGQLTAGLAHEVNTPLAASLNYLHQARSLADEYAQSIGNSGVTNNDHSEIAKELQKSLKDASITLDRLGEFVRKMRNQTRFSSNEATLFDPVSVAQDTLAMLEHQAKNAKVEIRLETGTGTLLRGEPGRFTQVISNLVINAIHACEGKPGAKVEIVFGSRLQQGQFETIFSVPDEVLPKIFEPLFTTKPIGKGTGLGLSIIRDIVRGHFGGEVEVKTSVGQGTTFNIFLPLGTNAARAGTDQARVS